MSMSGIEAVGFTPFQAPTVSAANVTAGPIGPQSSSTSDFGALVADGIERLEAVQTHADQLSVKAATGDLDAMHDYTIAATEASVTTQLTVSLRNRAVEAFNEIMRMQV